ncbi:MAG TPA: hypothetical protein VM054_10030 [bacterium]|nr:hypothetical protein [bacterium]
MRRTARRNAPLFLGSALLLAACGNLRQGDEIPVGTSASERLAEARTVAVAYLPDGMLCEALGLDYGPTFGDGRCPDWTYTFYSAVAASVFRVHLGPDGLLTPLGEPEKLLPGQSPFGKPFGEPLGGPPAWDGDFFIDSDFAAKSARMASASRSASRGAVGILSEGTPVSERLRLCARGFPDGVKPVWELTYTVRGASGFKTQTVTVDAATGRMLENEPFFE